MTRAMTSGGTRTAADSARSRSISRPRGSSAPEAPGAARVLEERVVECLRPEVRLGPADGQCDRDGSGDRHRHSSSSWACRPDSPRLRLHQRPQNSERWQRAQRGRSDAGDATDNGECPSGAPGRDSSWHGTFVSGIVAANSDSGVGMAGVDWKAKILPVRALGRCSRSFDDILAAILWAAGIPVRARPRMSIPHV